SVGRASASQAEGRGFEPHRPLLQKGVLIGAVAALAFAAASSAVASPAAKRPTKVYVTEFEFGFKLSRQAVPAGKVIFVMRNTGAVIHNFDLIGVKVGPFLVSGQTAPMTTVLKRGEYTYVCSVKYHAAQGMQGTLVVK